MLRSLKYHSRALALAISALATAGVALARQAGLVGTLDGHADPVYTIAWSPDGKQAATGAADKSFRQRDVEKGQVIRAVENVVYAIAYSPKGDLPVTAGDDKLVKYWNPADGKEQRESVGHGAAVYCLAFRPDGEKLAIAASDNKG